MPFSMPKLGLRRLTDVIEHFRKTYRRLVPGSGTVVVGYSGGADSTCLLHMAVESGFGVVAAHLHHGMRPEADDEQERCQEFADSLSIPIVVGRADVPGIAEKMKVGLEEAGREARYDFFRRVLRGIEGHKIATAHTRDDHVETILLHLARGSGLSGLKGIPESSDDLIRPLLTFSREQTREYCLANGLWFHDDPANDDVRHARSRVRHRVVPEMRQVHPGFDQSVARMASILRDEDDFLDSAAAASLETAELPPNGDLSFLTYDSEFVFDTAKLAALPPVLLRRALRLAVRLLGGSLHYDQTLVAANGIVNRGNGSVTAEGESPSLVWNPERVHIEVTHTFEPFRHPLPMPGVLDSPVFGWVFEGSSRESEEKSQRTGLTALIDPGKVQGDLFFRAAQTGDKMQPLGFDHQRKLSDLLSEAKLTQAARHRLPIVCDMIGPIWAPGVCLSDRVKSDEPGPKWVLMFGPLGSTETKGPAQA